MTIPSFDWHIWLTLMIVLGLIVLDFIFGVLTNLGSFSIQKFPSQLVNFVLPYFVPLVGLAIVQFITPLLNTVGITYAVGGTFYVFAAATAGKALADILAKLAAFAPKPAPAPPPPAA